MGTSNFHNVNASEIFVLDYEDDWEWYDCKDDIALYFKEKTKDDKLIFFEPNKEIESKKELRSFPTSSIGHFELEDVFLGRSIQIFCNVFIRSGYYQAANLDWELEYIFEGCEYEDDDLPWDSDEDCVCNDLRINKGLWKIHKYNMENRVSCLVEKLTDRVEELFKEVSTGYKMVAQASNGETFYEKSC